MRTDQQEFKRVLRSADEGGAHVSADSTYRPDETEDVLKSGGYNVYPAEIEGYINEMDGVTESALIGVSHPDFGAVGIAVVIVKPGATVKPEAILAALKGKLANFKIPKRCEVVSDCRATRWAKCKRICCARNTNQRSKN